jgi:hypothetical protein
MHDRFVKLLALVIFALAALSVCACTTLTIGAVQPEPQVTNLMFVAPDQAIIVGRIELHPPLQKGEQTLKSSSGEELRNAFILYGGNRLRDFTKSKPTTFEGSFATTLEKEFFIKAEKGTTFFVSGGTFYTEFDLPYHITYHTFSSPLQIEIMPDDEAVYVGTIQYYRDENNNVKTVMIRDDYQWADTQFKERFGTTKNLRKELATPVSFVK